MLLLFLAGAAAPPPDNALTLPPRQVWALVAEYADCIVKRSEGAASDAIQSDLTGDELLRKYPQLLQQNCVPMKMGDYIQVQFSGGQYREAIAEALVRRELAAAPPPLLDDVPGLSHSEPGPPPTTDARGRPLTGGALERAMSDYEQAKAASYLSRYGECVVRVDPAAAKALLLTEPETGEEAAAFSALGTAFGTCIAEGRSLTFGKAALRSTIAVNYYRLAMAARRFAATARAQ